jgi:hypothetical protein
VGSLAGVDVAAVLKLAESVAGAMEGRNIVGSVSNQAAGAVEGRNQADTHLLAAIQKVAGTVEGRNVSLDLLAALQKAASPEAVLASHVKQPPPPQFRPKPRPDGSCDAGPGPYRAPGGQGLSSGQPGGPTGHGRVRHRGQDRYGCS